MQRISLANTALALAAAPSIVVYADASFATRIGLATSLAFFGLMTTGNRKGFLCLCTTTGGFD